MDNDLNRSVRLLEDSLYTPTKGLFKSNLNSTKMAQQRDPDLSITLAPHELQRLMQSGDYFSIDDTMALLKTDKTITGSIIHAEEPWKTTVDSLYTEFLETLQGYSGGHDVLEVLGDLARCCSDVLKVVQSMKSKVSYGTSSEEKWLENERNTWRLMFILYQDRLHSQNVSSDTEMTEPYYGISEKLCITNLFKRDSLLRETQLIIDWLECNAADKDDEALHFSVNNKGWENSLHQLKNAQNIPFGATRKIVDKLDPDAPHYQKLPLHDLDAEDEKKLFKKMFLAIRAGKLEDAQKLCRESGHAWRAALFEGWRLYHDPNAPIHKLPEVESATPNKCIEGNPNRDTWKIMAQLYCKKEYLDLYQKAAMASFCGVLETMLPACYTWEDFLWAYTKVMVDIRVESELRDCVSRKYRELPEEYWDQKLSLNEIFENLESSKNDTVRKEAKEQEHIIQKLIILDQIPQLVYLLDEWTDSPTVDSQFVRFAVHIVLFLEHIGQTQNRESIEKILEVYISRLSQMGETALVAYYVSKVGPHRQVELYAGYMENIIDNDERRDALNYAESCGINVLACTKQVVENIRNHPHDADFTTTLQKKVTSSDKIKIAALDWLLFYEAQRAEAIIQTNALIFTFLTLGKLEGAQLAFNKLPQNSVEKIMFEGAPSDEIKQAFKEHFSYRAYLESQEQFNEWFNHYKKKPAPPENLSEQAQFTEKVAHQHRVAQYKSEIERWKITSAHLATNAKTLLYNVLLFPEGWLIGAKDADYLRSLCIPETAVLLYTVLFESGLHDECVQLADIIASEKHGLYKVFSKEKLAELLEKLCESSVALLNAKRDPWGNELSA